jgi:predicted nuclease of restriction endonuclease-like (RecB) superfamily
MRKQADKSIKSLSDFDEVSKERISALLTELSSYIDKTHLRIASGINYEMVQLYWSIGSSVRTEILHDDRASYGEYIVVTLSRELVTRYGTGFSEKNLRKMMQFSELFPDKDIVATLSRQLSWSHFVALLPLKDSLQRDFYAEMCRIERWSVRHLREKIQDMLFERTALSRKPEELARQELEALRKEDQMSPDLVFRDPYVFEFLGIKSQEVMYESDLEEALLQRLESFLLELGYGFCFEARQKRILIGNEYFFVDLVFYHRVLKCHVLIGLKTGGFSHEALEQLNTYLNYFKSHLMTEGDNPPVGLLLCTTQNHVLVQYACAGIENSVFVSKYQVRLPGTEEIREFVKGVIRDE